jgi:hypothetical protein
MRILPAAVAVALSGAILATSCVQSLDSLTETERGEAQISAGDEQTDTGEPTDAAREPLPLRGFKAAEFRFVTVIPDDGQEEGGGWQEAKADLSFVEITFPPRRWPRRWQCPITVQMPLRTRQDGRIAPNHAATTSAEVANSAKDLVDWNLPTGIFCQKFVDEMGGLFRFKYPKLGARVLKR